MKQWVWLFLCVSILATPASARKYVVIIAGAGGLETYQKQFQEQGNLLRDLLISRYGYGEEDVVLLTEFGTDDNVSTQENIRRLFRRLQSRITSRDDLIVFLIGHGSFDGDWSRFNLPGPDLRDIDFAALLDLLPVRRVVFVNFASASGPFVETLSRKNRILITATRNGIEKNATHFAEFFLQALQNPEKADFNKDGRLSVHEAFVAARDQLIRYYEEKRRLRPEHPLLEDNGDGKGSEIPDLFQGDGLLASRYYIKQFEPETVTQKETQKLDARQKAILEKVHALQARKSQMSEEMYYRQFEKLMIELARLNAQKSAARDTVLQR